MEKSTDTVKSQSAQSAPHPTNSPESITAARRRGRRGGFRKTADKLKPLIRKLYGLEDSLAGLSDLQGDLKKATAGLRQVHDAIIDRSAAADKEF